MRSSSWGTSDESYTKTETETHFVNSFFPYNFMGDPNTHDKHILCSQGNDHVVFIAVQTVFEGYSFNTKDKLRKNQIEYTLNIPMAHEAGNSDTHEIPAVMRRYRSGGTPWVVLIDPSGKVVFNDFHIKVANAMSLIERLIDGLDWLIITIIYVIYPILLQKPSPQNIV